MCLTFCQGVERRVSFGRNCARQRHMKSVLQVIWYFNADRPVGMEGGREGPGQLSQVRWVEEDRRRPVLWLEARQESQEIIANLKGKGRRPRLPRSFGDLYQEQLRCRGECQVRFHALFEITQPCSQRFRLYSETYLGSKDLIECKSYLSTVQRNRFSQSDSIFRRVGAIAWVHTTHTRPLNRWEATILQEC